MEDTLHPARQMEDKIARAMDRAAAGVYDSPPGYALANEQAAIELAVQSGQGMCGLPDAMGRCSSRYHALDCHHGQGVDWLASGPPRSTYAASLANVLSGIELAGPPPAVYGDSDDDDPPAIIPQQTIALAHELASEWGLLDNAPGAPDVTAAMDLLRPDTGPLSAYDSLAEPIGAPLRDGLPSVPGYPGISELAKDLGLK